MSVMAWVGLSILGIFALIFIILFVPIFFVAKYETGKEPIIYLRWFAKLNLIGKIEKIETVQKKEKTPKTEKAEKKEKTPMEFSQIIGIVLDAISALEGIPRIFVRRLRFHKIEIYMSVTGDDAADTAISFGKINALIYTAYALAQGFLNIAQPKISIRPDFTAQEGHISFEARARVLPIVLIGAVLRVGIKFFKNTISRRKTMDAHTRQDKEEKPDKQDDEVSN